MVTITQNTRTNIWFPFYVGDYRAETQGMTHEERGVYVDLLCAYCYRQAPIPDDDDQLARLCNLSIRKWRKFRPVIAPIFTIEQGLWMLPRLDKQIAHSLEVRKKRQEAGRIGGKKSGASRQAKAEANASPESKQMLNKSKSEYKTLTLLQSKGGVFGPSGETLSEAVFRGEFDE